MNKGHAGLKAELDIVVSRLEQVTGALATELAAQTRRAHHFRYEYERLSRSRVLRVSHGIRGVLSKTGLLRDYPIRGAEEIEASLGRDIVVDEQSVAQPGDISADSSRNDPTLP
jgi:hypothetical protein